MTTPLVTLRRVFDDGRATFGILEAGPYLIATMEPPWAGNARGLSCVPPGRYPLVLERSVKFEKHDYGDGPGMLWEMKEVPERSECKLHVANWPDQIEGCVALGDLHLWPDEINGHPPGRGLVRSLSALRRFHEALRPHKTARIEILRP